MQEYTFNPLCISLFQIMMRCSPSGSSEVSGKDYLEALEAAGISIDDREIAKVDKMTNDDGLIDRKVFLDYAKKSSALKSLLDSEKNHFDKAELAFKVRLNKITVITVINHA